MGDSATTSVETNTTNTDVNADASNSTVLTDDTTSTPVDDSNKDSDAANAAADDASASDENQSTNTGTEEKDKPTDTYSDFSLPEGMLLNETALTDATPLFKELGLNQEQGQKVIDLYAKQVQEGSQKQVDDFNQLTNDWRESAKKDGEFGGDKFDENVKVAQSAVSKYGTPEFKQLLNEYGIGDHPEVIRFMVKVGHTLSEDVPGSTGSSTVTKNDAVSILYPNESK